jgi:Transposase DDE domain group 1
MTTECTQFVFGIHPQKRREIRAQFDGGAITSDGGGLLLREVEKRIGMLRQFAACFTDYRNPDLIEHTMEELVAQRVYGLALGSEDLNDPGELRLAVLVEKSDPSIQVLAGKNTLNRLELTKETASRKERHKKIVLDHEAVDRLPVDIFLGAHREAPEEIILDLDATDDPLHGRREGRFFHGYYGHYCDLPLYIFC